ncbi:AraC family transcriptional regulator [Paenibacillaceae bacterium]|nr:AraC family transcriptional regulator [Paenibacillaceae bacterium]
MLKAVSLPPQGVNLYESKHQGNGMVEEHYHEIYQILFMLEGEGTITLDKRVHHVEADQAILIAPYCKHSVKSHSKLTVLVLAFDPIIYASDPFGSLLEQSFSRSLAIELGSFAASELRQMLRKILFEQSAYDGLYPLAIKVYLSEILLLLARTSLPAIPADSNSLRAERIRAYMDKRYFEKLTSDVIGDRMGISARHVNTIFKDQYGMTPTQYLTQVRMNLAGKLLLETDKDIISIAFEVGYENLPTFYRNFKSMFHMSPSHYRRAYRPGADGSALEDA